MKISKPETIIFTAIFTLTTFKILSYVGQYKFILGKAYIDVSRW